MPWEKNIILAISYKNHRKRSFAYSRDPLNIILRVAREIILKGRAEFIVYNKFV